MSIHSLAVAVTRVQFSRDSFLSIQKREERKEERLIDRGTARKERKREEKERNSEIKKNGTQELEDRKKVRL